MDSDSLWRDLMSEIRKQEPSGENPDEYIIFTKLKPKRNRIRVCDDHLERISTGGPQLISKSDVYEIASWAMDSPSRKFSIADPDLKPARMGSIVCTLLSLLPEFDYLPGRILVYREPSA